MNLRRSRSGYIRNKIISEAPPRVAHFTAIATAYARIAKLPNFSFTVENFIPIGAFHQSL